MCYYLIRKLRWGDVEKIPVKDFVWSNIILWSGVIFQCKRLPTLPVGLPQQDCQITEKGFHKFNKYKSYGHKEDMWQK